MVSYWRCHYLYSIRYSACGINHGTGGALVKIVAAGKGKIVVLVQAHCRIWDG
jgi:hypothetical protein